MERIDSRPPEEGSRWPPYDPSCSDGIVLSVLPGADRGLGLVRLRPASARIPRSTGSWPSCYQSIDTESYRLADEVEKNGVV